MLTQLENFIQKCSYSILYKNVYVTEKESAQSQDGRME